MPVYQPPPQTAQPPVQIPFSDPFHNRDPFMPSSQHRRKDSYGGQVGAPLTPMVGERAWGAQPGPLEPPPPPPFASRNMPPPSPSSGATPSFPNHHSRGPPSQSPYPGPRDLPPFGARPSGGMSIGSLIGNDRPSQGDRSPKAMTTQNSPNMRPSQQLSPKRARSTSMREDYGRAAPRPLSPRGHIYAQPDPRDERERWFSGRPYGGPPPPAPPGPPSFRPYQSSPTSVAGQSPHTNGIGAPPRPNSQPSSSVQERIEAWRAAAQPEHRVPGGFREYPPHHNEPQHRYDIDERLTRPMMDHGRQIETQPPLNHAPYPPPAHRDDRDPYARHGYVPLERRHEYDDRRPPEPRSVPAAVSSPPSAGDHGFESRFRHYGGPPLQDRDRHETSSQPGGRRDDDGHPIPRAFLTVSPELNRKGGRSSPLPQAVQGAQPRHTGPGGTPSIKYEFGRMFSGLGSGVGGTGTPTGPFSASGNLTPSRLSPSRFVDGDHDRPIESGEHETVVDGTSVLHRADRSDATREDADSITGRSTPTGQHRGSKRAKTAHHHHHHQHAHHHHHHHHTPEDGVAARGGFNTLRFPPNASGTPGATALPAGHHHHHHQHNHAHAPHHHHHTKPAPVVPAPKIHVKSQEVFDTALKKPRVHLGSALYAPNLSLPSNRPRPLEEMKRFFAATPGPIPYFADKENATFTIRVPRSYLATSHTEAAPVAGGLEEICDRRAIWGTEIYTDDSDVVAAAVHSGWIKGDFGLFNDDLRALQSESTNGTNGEKVNGNGDTASHPDDSLALEKEKLDEKPSHPVTVPEEKDMHVTIVILPPLERYEGSVMHHLKSRSWGRDHDGMSFIIQRIEFVDEGRETRYVERGMGARKRKVREEMVRREAAEGLLGLGRSMGVGVGA
ncbi:Hypothetical protein D9617_11g008420 [Elsinoe fawcettii]|nr:Hypothetical protein D9617_11g008420 [Elsinoe fawcettii]